LIPRSYISRRTGVEEVFYPCHTWPKTRCKGVAN
jgi:hypothetical protein